jgi:hypothetical protein
MTLDAAAALVRTAPVAQDLAGALLVAASVASGVAAATLLGRVSLDVFLRVLRPAR